MEGGLIMDSVHSTTYGSFSVSPADFLSVLKKFGFQFFILEKKKS
jgi:hypothetical protein